MRSKRALLWRKFFQNASCKCFQSHNFSNPGKIQQTKTKSSIPPRNKLRSTMHISISKGITPQRNFTSVPNEGEEKKHPSKLARLRQNQAPFHTGNAPIAAKARHSQIPPLFFFLIPERESHREKSRFIRRDDNASRLIKNSRRLLKTVIRVASVGHFQM